MKSALALIIVTFTLLSKANACNQKLEFQVGPFFSTSGVFQYWQDFAVELGKQTGCKVQTLTSSNFDQYLVNIIDKNNHIYIAPDHYTKAFNKLGYRTILRSNKAALIYLVSRHNLTSDKISSSLEGNEILVPSIYTRAYLELENWLKDRNLLGKVKFDFNHSHDSAALLMLKGKKSTTIMLDAIYRVLPESLKESFNSIPISAKSGAYLHVHPDLQQEVISSIIKLAEHLKFHKWSKATPPFKEPYEDRLIEQINQFRPKAIN